MLRTAVVSIVLAALTQAGCSSNDDGCSADSDCAGGQVCREASCVPAVAAAKENGATCAANGECASGYCTDGVCCESACDGACLACNKAWTDRSAGVCAPVRANTDPDGECLADAPATCGARGAGCNGDAEAPGCLVYDATTECAPANCTGGSLTGASLCDGVGSCVGGSVSSCRPYACNVAGEGCLDSCGSHADCLATAFCDGGGQCVDDKTSGPCTEAEECASGFCSDGVCCDQACDGECNACSTPAGASTDGVCEVLPGATTTCSIGICNGASDQCTAACVSEPLAAPPAAVDVILLVDNSVSMPDEIQALEANININFANVMEAANVDYQIILVAQHGAGSYDVCVGPPLSATTDCAAAPAIVPGQFYHYSTDVQSHHSLCVALDTLYGAVADDFNIAPNGWSQWLRSSAHKAFVELSDDGTSCTWNGQTFDDENTVAGGQSTALDFDSALLAQSPVQFGTSAARNYSWYSIVGLDSATALDPTDPWLPADPVITNQCTTSVDPGTAYQWLSKGTDALRFPMCETGGYDVILQSIATDLSNRFYDPCRFAVPSPPQGQTADTASILLTWTPSAGADQTFGQVDGSADCAAGAFYLQEDTIQLCPATCATTTADPDGTLEAHFLCD